MNRGNYRDDIFLVEGSGEVFEKTLFEACGRFGWVLHAYVAMSNHYHMGSMYTVSRLVAQENRRPKGRRKVWRKILNAKR